MECTIQSSAPFRRGRFAAFSAKVSTGDACARIPQDEPPRLEDLLSSRIIPMFRQVFTDGRPLPTVTEPTWLGYSVGRREGETFVVETTGFKDRGWLDTRKGRPHNALHVTERFRRRDFGHIALAITIDDPKAYVRPWTVATVLTQADTEMLEAFCDNQDKTMEHRRITPPPPEPPSVPR